MWKKGNGRKGKLKEMGNIRDEWENKGRKVEKTGKEKEKQWEK